jgi:hypothetical protein
MVDFGYGDFLMRPTRLVCITLFFLCAASSTTHAQKREPNFPTDDEIRLVLTQAERAVAEYKPLLDREEKVIGEAGAEALAKDRELVRAIDSAIAVFGKNPQEFNGPLGFAFYEWLDDTTRNALLTAVHASNAATVGLFDGDNHKAESNIELAKDLSNVSTVFYTVSENAGALYSRYVEGEEELAKVGLQVATDCTDFLKKRKKAVSKP